MSRVTRLASAVQRSAPAMRLAAAPFSTAAAGTYRAQAVSEIEASAAAAAAAAAGGAAYAASVGAGAKKSSMDVSTHTEAIFAYPGNPAGYDPMHVAKPVTASPTLLDSWQVAHLTKANVAAEPAYTGVVADLPAVARADKASVSSRYNYKHTFTLTELSHADFLKKVMVIEQKLLHKFGSTAVLRVKSEGRSQSKKFAVLRSPFVHKKAQDHYKYQAYSYDLQIAYTFELTDAALNQYVYNTVKSLVGNMGAVTNFGYSITHKTADPKARAAYFAAKRAEAAAELQSKLATSAEESVASASAFIAQSKNTFYDYVAEAEKSKQQMEEARQAAVEAAAAAAAEEEALASALGAATGSVVDSVVADGAEDPDGMRNAKVAGPGGKRQMKKLSQK